MAVTGAIAAPTDTARRTLNQINGTLLSALGVLKEHGRGAEAELAWQQASRRSEPRVIVVGETKRGKSSLVNALAGTPGLSPVGAEETTSTYVSLRADRNHTGPPVAELLLADGTRRPIRVEDLPRWGEEDDPDDTVVVGADIRIAPGPLGEISLTDTPGIGSLRGDRAEVTRRAAAQSGALLFVVDAGSPLSQPELEFLQSCSSSVEFVLVAVTMTDKYPDTAAQMVDYVRDQLVRRDRRLRGIPVLGVSAQLATMATSLPPAQAELVLTASGLPALTGSLGGMVAQRGAMPPVNALRTCRSALTSLLEEQSGLRRAQLGRPAPGDSESRERAVDELRTRRSRWREDLQRDWGRLRAELIRLINDRLDDQSEAWRHRIERSPLFGGPTFRREFALEISAGYELLRQDVADLVQDRLTALATTAFAPDPVPASVREAVDVGAWSVRRRSVDPQRGRGDLIDPMMIAGGAAGARLAMISWPVLGPLAVLAGGAGLAVGWLTRNRRLDRQGLLAELGRQIQQERSALVEEVDAEWRELRPELVHAVEEQLVAHERRLKQEQQQAREAATRTAESNQRAVADIDSMIKQLADLTRSVDDALAQGVRLLRSSPGTNPASRPSD